MRLIVAELRSRLQYKIIVPFLLLTLCVALAGSAVAFRLVAGSWQERFSNQLESRLLGQLLDNISNGNTGSMSTDAFLIDVIDDSGALSIKVTDRATGEVSIIEVSGLNP